MKVQLPGKMIMALLFSYLTDLEGFAPNRHLIKEDGKSLDWLDETAQFMVIEFDRNDKKIILSHSRIWEQARADEKNAEMKEKKAEVETTKKAVKNIQSKVEKTTLGDLGVLADLKKKMDDEGEVAIEKQKATAQKEEAKKKKVVAEKKVAEEEKETGDAEKKDEEESE